MAWRPHPRGASTDRSAPRAWATCDRCGFIYNHYKLSWQYDWAGPQLINKRFLVCPRCLDVPQENLRTIVIPPDPPPIYNARPEPYSIDEGLAQPDMSILVPAYIYPTLGTWSPYSAPPAAYTPLGPPRRNPRTIICNPASGPGTGPIGDYVNALTAWKAQPDTFVLGYVTAFLSGSFRSAAAVEADIAGYFNYYPGMIDGIYLDQVSNTSLISTLYQPVLTYASINFPVKTFVLGTGAIPATSVWLTLTPGAGVALGMSWENTYAALTTFSPPAWMSNYPASSYYFLVHDTPTLANMQNAVNLVNEANASNIYVTNGTQASGNPYLNLPPYWTSFVAQTLLGVGPSF